MNIGVSVAGELFLLKVFSKNFQKNMLSIEACHRFGVCPAAVYDTAVFNTVDICLNRKKYLDARFKAFNWPFVRKKQGKLRESHLSEKTRKTAGVSSFGKNKENCGSLIFRKKQGKLRESHLSEKTRKTAGVSSFGKNKENCGSLIFRKKQGKLRESHLSEKTRKTAGVTFLGQNDLWCVYFPIEPNFNSNWWKWKNSKAQEISRRLCLISFLGDIRKTCFLLNFVEVLPTS